MQIPHFASILAGDVGTALTTSQMTCDEYGLVWPEHSLAVGRNQWGMWTVTMRILVYGEINTQTRENRFECYTNVDVVLLWLVWPQHRSYTQS